MLKVGKFKNHRYTRIVKKNVLTALLKYNKCAFYTPEHTVIFKYMHYKRKAYFVWLFAMTSKIS